ncbi:MAG: hypothetical protein ACRYG8_29115 [Janthinobacterium lividum]
MSAAKSAGDRLSARLRELFATLLGRPPVPEAVFPAGTTTAKPQKVLFAQALAAEPGPETTPAATPVQERPARHEGRQIVLFAPPETRSGERTLFLEDFVARFRETIRRSGVIARDPLYAVLTMLGEMLVHFSHLQADQAAAARQVTDRFVAEMARESARIREAIGREAKDLAKATVHAGQHIETLILEAQTERTHVARAFDSELKSTLQSYASTRTWRERLITTALLLVVALAMTGGGVLYGKWSERQLMDLTLETLKEPILKAAMQFGTKNAEEWLHLMRWNDLSTANRVCKTQAAGTGYRMVCDISLWTSAPLLEPPPS